MRADDLELGNDQDIDEILNDEGWGATPERAEERAIIQEVLEDTRRRSSRVRQRTEVPAQVAQVAPPPARRQRTAASTPTTTYRSLGASAEADQAPPTFRSLGSSPCTVAVDDEVDEPVFRSAATGEEDEEVYPNPNP